MLLNSHIIAKKLKETLSIVAEVLSETQREDIVMLIDAGEWGLALETLGEFLYEEELPIISKAYKSLKEVNDLLKLNCSLLKNLKNQISN